jgi:putative transposase
MTWKEIKPMDQKTRLIGDWLSDEFTIVELSDTYDVSRKTIYKWIERYKEGGPAALEEMSHEPHRHPNATPPEIIDQLISTKLKHKNWGPKKLVAWLNRHEPEENWPAPSTTGSILKKEGLVQNRHFHRHTPLDTEPFRDCSRPNDVWSMDYKGQFRMLDNKYCYPFTLTDNCSRYLLACQGLLHPTHDNTQPCLERAFREYGLPKAIRSDNGTPFASVGLGGLSKLSIWLIKLWITPERIDPGHPEQNGRHERMHRSLKEATTKPPQANLEKQQKVFDAFRKENNEERPHEALNQAVPASYYEPSRRLFPDKVPEVEYSSCYTVRQVRNNGEIKWKGGFIYISQALAGEPIGLIQVGESKWEIKFIFHPLGILDESIGKVSPFPKEGRKVPPICPV